MRPSKKQNEEIQTTIAFQEGSSFAVSDFVLQTLEAFGGKTEGKTLLQKRVYFVGVLTESLPVLEYRAHFYGPYSGAVDVAIGRLCKLDFVTQTVDEVPVSGTGLEVKRFSFSITSDGREIASPDTDDERGLAFKRTIQEASQRILRAGNLDSTALSIAAKTHFLLEQRGGVGRSHEVAEMAQDFNWNITPDQVLAAADFLQRLRLVSIAETKNA